MIRRGVRYGHADDLQRAILCLIEGLGLIDEKRDPRLALSAFHNLALFLAHLELPTLARATIGRARDLYRRVGDAVMRVRLIWLQGTVARFSEHFDLAARRLAEAAERFDALGRPDEAGQVRDELRQVESLRAAAASKRTEERGFTFEPSDLDGPVS